MFSLIQQVAKYYVQYKTKQNQLFHNKFRSSTHVSQNVTTDYL